MNIVRLFNNVRKKGFCQSLCRDRDGDNRLASSMVKAPTLDQNSARICELGAMIITSFLKKDQSGGLNQENKVKYNLHFDSPCMF